MKTKHPIFSRWLVLLGPCFRVSSVLFAACVTPLSCFAADLGSAPVFAVKELSYTSATTYSPTAYPADPAGLTVVFQHSGGTTLSISGFWDGDGLGGSSGNVWKVRFTPTLSGTWTVLSETSSIAGLEGDHLGDTLTATAPTHPGFWLPDPDSANGRWFKRSDGSHPYILGNTHYDFLHAPNGNDATPATIVSDIEANATRYNKLRFGLSAPGSRNINSSVRPFFDASGNQVLVETDRPNPAFFRQRVDAAVQRGYELDFICDLILELGDNQLATNPTYLRYVAARYGAYPNVWFCLGNESLERNTTSTVNSIGNTLRAALPYPSPVSVHMVRGWEAGLSGTWYSHTINQYKLDQHFVVEKRNLAGQADRQISEFNKPNVLRPVINDECAYDPNEATELQAIESSTGCFLGGAYSSGGEKTASKQGGYFFGYSAVGSTIDAHPSSDNTGWLRQKIDQYIPFWTLSPSTPAIFGNLATQFRALAAPGSFYVLGSNSARTGITAALPTGTWTVRQLDVVAKTDTLLSASASGTFTFSTPSSVATVTIFSKNENLQLPATPTGLSATPITSTRIDLAWTDAATNETSYQLQRRLHTETTWTDLAAALPADTTAYSDTTVTQTLTYDYRLRAVNSDGPSAWSAEVSATAPAGTAPEILSPASGTTFAPLSQVTLTGVGADLAWSVTGAVTTSGTGSSLAFSIPATATNGDSVLATLTGSGTQTQRSYAILDSFPEITTTSDQLFPATVNQPYSDDLEAIGGDGAIVISLLSGSLPDGLSIANNNLTGTPAAVGTYSFIVQAQDADGDTATANLTLTVAAAPDPAQPFLESAGQLVIEAENFTGSATNGDTTAWTPATALAGFDGTGYVETPNAGGANSASYAASAEVSYALRIATPGTYKIWLRRNGPDGASNSARLGFNGTSLVDSLDNASSGSTWGWFAAPATVTLAAGDHTLNLRRREDGYRVDKILLTSDTAFTPTGTGPAESPHATAASALATFRTSYGLAADGSQDTATPAGDGVANLLKYAFNMLGSGVGQGTSLTTPNASVLLPEGFAGLPFADVDGTGKLQLTYIRRKATASPAPGITYTVEFSNDLGVTDPWAANPSATESAVSLDATFERVTITDDASPTRRFTRVKIISVSP